MERKDPGRFRRIGEWWVVGGGRVLEAAKHVVVMYYGDFGVRELRGGRWGVVSGLVESG